MKSTASQSTSWSSLLSSAIQAAQMLVATGGRRKRDISRLKQAEIERTADFAQFLYRLKEKIEHHAEGQLHAAQLVAEELRFFFGAQAAAVFLNDRCIHRSLTQKEIEKLTQKLGVGLPRSGVPTCRVETVSVRTTSNR